MFTGIIESEGIIKDLQTKGSNLTIAIQSAITHELKVDQSVSHNGVCLTVVNIEGNVYEIDAIDETLSKTNLKELKIGDIVNLERCMKMNGRLDGHIVQGHVDQTAVCKKIAPQDGSWIMTFAYKASRSELIVEKGSICVNGISLTAFDVTIDSFSVAVIPYTYDHTNMRNLKVGDEVNLEFDILGKYIARLMEFKS